MTRSWDNGRRGGGPLQQGTPWEIPRRAGCQWALGERCGPPTSRTCQTDLDAGAVPARPGVRHLPPTIGQPRIQRCRPPARPGPAPPPPPQGYGSGLGAGVRAGTQTPRPRRPGGGRMAEPGNRRCTRRPDSRSVAPSPAQSGAAASTTSEPDARRPHRFRRRRRLPEPRAFPPSCRPGPARARAVCPRACVRARPRGTRRGGEGRGVPCGCVARLASGALGLEPVSSGSRSHQAWTTSLGSRRRKSGARDGVRPGTPYLEASAMNQEGAKSRPLAASARVAPSRAGWTAWPTHGRPRSCTRCRRQPICGCGRGNSENRVDFSSLLSVWAPDD